MIYADNVYSIYQKRLKIRGNNVHFHEVGRINVSKTHLLSKRLSTHFDVNRKNDDIFRFAWIKFDKKKKMIKQFFIYCVFTNRFSFGFIETHFIRGDYTPRIRFSCAMINRCVH